MREASGMAANPFAQAAGYTVDLVYPSSFILGQTPLQMQWAAVIAGAARGPLTDAFNYCDLGCGNGTNLCLLAACYPRATFIGIDLNEAHVALARDRALRAGLSNLRFVQASFDDLERIELPELDYIAAFGVYSWLSNPLRDSIDGFVARKLRPGGLFSVHYTSLPGAAIRDPLNFYLRLLSPATAGGSAERLARGIDSLRALAPVSRFFAEHPQAVETLRGLDRFNAGRVAHDVLNSEPHSFYFAEVHHRLNARGMDFLGSANVLPDYPELQMSRPAFATYEKLVAGADPAFREAIRDFMLNTAVRFDLYTRTASQAESGAPVRRLARLGDLHIYRAGAGPDIEMRRRLSASCSADLASSVHTAVQDLASRPEITLGELLVSPALAGFDATDVDTAIQQLFALGLLNVQMERPIQAEFRSDRRYRLGLALNAMRLEETLGSPGAEGLASPILGSPLLVPHGARLQLMALLGGDPGRASGLLGDSAKITPDQLRERVRSSLPRFVAEDVPQLLRLGIIEEDH